ncbi:PRC-barrel domain-containing protein [Roseomonas sp. NAR14]|uniref:PRC-barrel domain-containing protein n=1 Tax=Roseomonas acroporae TaxID=2937791 RepID=A0A9X2C072_9PROT|nr:PRC-barrel domain-containing protein [Roseomonas acroporae]MCK8787860.1 PRC-barrel domain-containing protein [Roseomonas acroporae]
MSKRFVVTAAAAAALTGAAALAQTAQPTVPAPTPTPAPAPSAGVGPNQTLPGWGGTPAPQPGQPAPPGGLVTVVPGAVVVTYYAVQPADMTASNLMRTEVRNMQDERIGRIEDLVIGNGREVTAVVIGVGGFLGIGERFAAVPPSAVVLTRQPDGGMRAVVDATREQLRNSPEFRFEGNVRR